MGMATDRLIFLETAHDFGMTPDDLLLSIDQALEDPDLVAFAISPGGRPMDDSPFSTSKTSNWVARAGGLPKYLRGIAHALMRKGKSESEAIEMAWGILRNWAQGKGNVSAKVRAAAVKALAEIDAKRAKAKAT